MNSERKETLKSTTRSNTTMMSNCKSIRNFGNDENMNKSYIIQEGIRQQTHAMINKVEFLNSKAEEKKQLTNIIS